MNDLTSEEANEIAKFLDRAFNENRKLRPTPAVVKLIDFIRLKQYEGYK